MASDEFKRRLEAYERVLKTEEWKFLKDTIFTIKGVILDDLLSSSFTGKNMTEKDVAQRVYYQTSQILDYFLEPTKWLKKKSAWQRMIKKGE